MSAPPSKPSQPVPTTFNERLNEQLINCLNVQTNVIQNLTQYSQHISIQLFEIKSIVEILSNRVLALQQQQQLNQQSHFPGSQYAHSYYPNYIPQQPMPVSQPTMSVSHPPPASHQPPFPFSVQQQPGPMRVPATTASSTNLPFFPTNTVNPPASLPSSVPSFQFSTPTSQATITNVLPTTTTTPTKSPFPSLPKFTTADTITKPSSLFSTTSVTTSLTSDKPTTGFPFVFGTNNAAPILSGASLTSGLSTVTVTKPDVNADDDGEGDGEDDSYIPEGSFTAIVELPVVEVKTGEEDENVLFCERGKLYRFDANQMKERGIGEMKILQHKTTKLCRILMRREQVLKICANHKITSQMELKPHQGSANAYVWSAMDFADGEAKPETLCIRFKTDEQAKNFLKVFNEAKEINTKQSSDLSSTRKISVKEEPNSNTNDDDVVSIGEVKPSAEQIDRAKKLQLPSTFYLYENKEPCKGCPGCEEDTPTIVYNENKTSTKKQSDTVKTEAKPTTPQSQSTPSVSKTPLGSSENTKFSFTNAEKTQPLQKQGSVSKEEKPSVESSSLTATNIASQYDNKPSIFGNSNTIFGSSAFGTATPLNNASGSIFGGDASLKSSANTTGGFSFPGFGNTTTPSNGFQFSTPAATSTTTAPSSTFSFGAALASATASTSTSATKPVFGNSPKFSFADLAKQSSTSNTDKTTSNGTEQRVFAGQGSLIFGTSSPNISTRANNDDDEGGDAGGEDDSYEPNVSFKPIVQLSAVEVKTGEEDENVLFCERGKLYRFDADANQMKERGIGEMKILQHKTTKLCRILMRREQVLKICANHQITSQMDLKPHQGSENAYVWSAIDFADGEAKHETLCIRFKSSDSAKRFFQQFNEAKQSNAPAVQH